MSSEISELGFSENHTTLEEYMKEQASEIEPLKSENERYDGWCFN